MPLEMLTDRRVKTAKPPEGQERLELRDTKVRGLELRVGRTEGSKRWALLYTRKSDGVFRWVTIGRYPETGLAEARQKAHQLKVVVDNGGDPAANVQERKTSPTFSELAADWVELHARPNKKPQSVADNISMLERHINPEIGFIKAEDLTKRDIIRLLDVVASKADARIGKKKAKKKSNQKILDVPVLDPKRTLSHRPNRVFEVVRGILRWAISRDIIEKDPSSGMRPPLRKERPRERTLSATEIHKFWTKLDEAPLSDGVRLALRIALVTAQRIGEVSCLAKSELRLDTATPVWSLPSARSKNKESHRIPLSPLAVRLIKQASELSGDSPYLFPSPRGDQPIGAHAATKGMERSRPILGLPDFRVHDLRRSAATGMAELGISPHTISLVLNHISARAGTITSAVYVKYSYDKEKREALEAWGERLEEILKPQSEAAAE